MAWAAARRATRLLVAGTIAVLGCTTVTSAGVSAHPIDELLQQVYVTPTSGGIEIDIEITPGVAVAPAFLALVDTDGDGSLSTVETAAHAELLHAALTLQVDGAEVTTTVASAVYPEADLLVQGGGTIVVELLAELAHTDSERSVIVTDSYAPNDLDGSPMVTTVQVNLTPSPAAPVEAGTIEHSADGRSLTAGYSMSAPPAAATTTVTESTSSAGATWWTIAAGIAVGSIVAAVAIRRRRTARPAS